MITIDFETRSRVDIGDCGVNKYLECPDFGVLLVALKFDNQPAVAISKGNPYNPSINQEFIERVRAGELLVAHNVGFDYRVYRQTADLFGWPQTRITQWICTQTAAYAAGLPGKLGQVAAALGLAGKLSSGTRLINQLSCPDKAGRFCDDKAKLRAFIDYALRDVELTYEVYQRLLPVIHTLRTDFELRMQQADLEMNDVGMFVDYRAIETAITLNDKMSATLDSTLKQLTDGAVSTVSEVKKMAYYIQQWLPYETSVNKESVDRLLRCDIPLVVRKVLNIRRAGSNTSIAKYQAMKSVMGKNGRIRDTLRIYGAYTGRWAGRIVQTQNLPGGKIENYDNASLAESLSNDGKLPNGVPWGKGLSSAIRGCIMAAPGYRLLVSDYNAIECRILAWLARQMDLLQLFAEGGDPYKEMASTILGKPVEQITDKERKNPGKITELGCGYGMGYKLFADFNNLLTSFAQKCVSAYRRKRPNIPKLWRVLERAAISAVSNPGVLMQATHNIGYLYEGEFLMCILPSGRRIYYFQPQVSLSDPWDTGELVCQLSYITRSKSGVFRTTTWGGSLTENICQAVARDVICNGIDQARSRGMKIAYEAIEAGPKITLQVHDEVVAEVPEGEADYWLSVLESSLVHKAPWMTDLPLAVESWTGRRYKK
jgi:DNA polymerase